MIRSGPSSARPEWKPPWEAQVEKSHRAQVGKSSQKKKKVSFREKHSSEASVRIHDHETPALIGGLSADENEIIVDWSSGIAKSNISSDTVSFSDNVGGKSRRELQARAQSDDLLGKSTFIPPTSQPPLLESVKIGSYQSSVCK